MHSLPFVCFTSINIKYSLILINKLMRISRDKHLFFTLPYVNASATQFIRIVNGAAVCVGDKLACFLKVQTSIHLPAAFVITVTFFCLLVFLFISFIDVTH
jgi:hypothetical protein